METCAKVGLRDRKRAETQARIEAAAVELVLRDGLEAATVEMISERAGVSPRTFFNYFASKDSAVLGVSLVEPAEQALEARLDSADLDVDDPVVLVVRMVMAAMGAHMDDGRLQLGKDRLAVLRRYPQIMGGQFGGSELAARKGRIADRVGRALAAHPRFDDDADARARAVMVLSLCAVAVRAAVDEWASAEDSGGIESVEQRAVALVHDTVRRLQ